MPQAAAVPSWERPTAWEAALLGHWQASPRTAVLYLTSGASLLLTPSPPDLLPITHSPLEMQESFLAQLHPSFLSVLLPGPEPPSLLNLTVPLSLQLSLDFGMSSLWMARWNLWELSVLIQLCKLYRVDGHANCPRLETGEWVLSSGGAVVFLAWKNPVLCPLEAHFNFLFLYLCKCMCLFIEHNIISATLQ